MITINSAVASRSGKMRDNNEDNYYINGQFINIDTAGNLPTYSNSSSKNIAQIFAVFDGFGDEKRGNSASLFSAKLLQQYNSVLVNNSQSDVSNLLKQYINEANNSIRSQINEVHGRRIGTTLAMLCVKDEKAYVLNVGDSRVYLFRAGNLIQITEDHTQAQRMVELGILKKERARIHPQKGKLTQYIGILPNDIVLEPLYKEINTQPDDIFIVCSDGITDSIDDKRIVDIISFYTEPNRLAEMLVSEAYNNGGKDDLTALVVMINDSISPVSSVVAGGAVLHASGKSNNTNKVNKQASKLSSSHNSTSNKSVSSNKKKSSKESIWQTLVLFIVSFIIMSTLSGFGYVRYSAYVMNNNSHDNIPSYFKQNDNKDDPGIDIENNELQDTPYKDNGNWTPKKTSNSTPKSTESTPSPEPQETETPDLSPTSTEFESESPSKSVSPSNSSSVKPSSSSSNKPSKSPSSSPTTTSTTTSPSMTNSPTNTPSRTSTNTEE